jgi:hypothetical protein
MKIYIDILIFYDILESKNSNYFKNMIFYYHNPESINIRIIELFDIHRTNSDS